MKKIFFSIIVFVLLAQIAFAFGDIREDFTTPGTATWTVPEGVFEITVEAWGGGAQSASGLSTDYGGGGGGAYARSTIAVTPGQTFDVRVGQAGTAATRGSAATSSWFNSSTTLLAQPGGAGSGSTGGAGGSAATSIGNVTFSGGDGGDGLTNTDGSGSGGGGGAAGPLGDGGNGEDAFGICDFGGGCWVQGGSGGSSGQEGTAGEGGAGEGQTDPGIGFSSSTPGNIIGGGAGGAGGGQIGARGEVRIHYTPVKITEFFTDPGTTTWTAPAGVHTIIVEAWGGGGGGGGSTSGSGGGGGGAYARSTIAVTPGQTYDVVVGAGGSGRTGTGADSHFNSSSTVMAKGGAGSTSSTGGGGGEASSSVGDVKFSGSAGGSGLGTSPYVGGGGGGGGGTGQSPSFPGGDASPGFPGLGASGGEEFGGDGGAGGTSSTSGSKGSVRGGGGGGAGDLLGGGGGGAGGRGEVRITYTKQYPNVQQGLTSFSSSTTGTQTIATVNSSNAFVRHTMRAGSGVPSILNVMSELEDNGSQITFSRYNTGTTNSIVDWEVIESSDITVQRGVESFSTTDSTADITIDAVNLSEAFVIISSRTNSGTTSQFNRGMFTARLTSSTNLELLRAATGSAAEVSWQVIEWRGSNVQSGLTTMASSSTTTVSLSESVNPQNAFVITSTRTAETTLERSYIRANISSGTDLVLTRESSTGFPSVSWYVVEHPDFFVQRGQRTITGVIPASSSLNPSVNSDRSFHSLSWSSTGTGTSHRDAQITSHIRDETVISFQKGTASQTQTVNYEVISMRGPCDPPFGQEDWTVIGFYNCIISEDQHLYQNNFTCSGTGNFIIQDSLFSANSITASNGCRIIGQSGAQVRSLFYPEIVLSNRTVFNSAADFSLAGITFGSGGQLSELTQSGFFFTDSLLVPGEWANINQSTQTLSNPGRWEVRATLLSGTAPSGPSLNTWHPLSANREWSVSTSFSEVVSNLFFEIRDAQTEKILTDAEITLHVCETTGGCSI